MTGDYTKVPLREQERWTGARMQQGRVLLDHEWNLNLDAADRASRSAMRDVIGLAGAPAGSPAFQVSIFSLPLLPPGLLVHPGRIWVDGMAAHAPAAFRYADQDAMPPLPVASRVLVYLDVFPEHVQPVEDWEQIVDPALDPVDAGARVRVGYRVRAVPTSALTCKEALAALGLPQRSTGTLTITREAPAESPDPCDPPGDPYGLLPNGLLRVEVLDAGDAKTARFAWSAENGGTAARAASISGNQVTLAANPAVKFAAQDLVEISWLARRADRQDHGPLYRIDDVKPDISGDLLILDRPVFMPATAHGQVIRRWDGHVRGADTLVTAPIGGADLGVRFVAGTGTFLAGDHWNAWLRPAAPAGVEPRPNVPADGVPHAFVPLAMVDLVARKVLEDGRPAFPSLTTLPRATCTVTAFPGDDLQAAADRLPATGGELCLGAGVYVLGRPVRIAGKRRVTVTGVGPATVLTSPECAFLFENCADVEVSGLRAECGHGRLQLDGALTFEGCSRVRVRDCQLACADAVGDGRTQTCVTVRGSHASLPRDVRVESNRLEVGTAQTGVLILDGNNVLISGNDITHVSTANRFSVHLYASELARVGADTVGGTARFGPRLQALRAELRNRALPMVQQGVTFRQALRVVARTMIEEIGADRAHQIVGAGSPSQLCAGSQGVVVAGTRAQAIRVLDNVISGVTEGIHVGTSNRATPGLDVAAEVLIARNLVTVSLPALYNRGRHAIFAGNVSRLSVLENFADLRRLHAEERSPVDGIRVMGALGPYAMIRESVLTGFTVGVRFDPPSTGAQHLWVVTDTVASGAAVAVLAPAGVAREPNVVTP